MCFGFASIQLLGHKISSRTIRPHSGNKAIKEAGALKDAKDLKRCWGM